MTTFSLLSTGKNFKNTITSLIHDPLEQFEVVSAFRLLGVVLLNNLAIT